MMSLSTSYKLLALGLFIPVGLAGCAGEKESPGPLDGSVECVADDDCPPDVPGMWSACVGLSDDCAAEGAQARPVLTFTCKLGTCRMRERIEQRACSRSTEGLSCHDAGTIADAGTTVLDASAAAGAVVPRIVPGSSSAPSMGSCASTGTACNTGNACELGKIQCVDGQPRCVAVGVAATDTVCRPASGPCDLEERCDGTSGVCPADAFAGPASVCRPATGPCDRDETCTGAGAACPADVFVEQGTECRPGTGACDVGEVCTGSSPMCPADDAGCGDGYCLIDTCHAQPSIHVQGNAKGDGGTCSDLARGQDMPALRITFRGRPHAPVRYWRRHVSCAGSAFEEHAPVPCDEGTTGQFDATGTCTYTVRNQSSGAACPDPRVGRWELAVEVDGQRSPSAFVDFHHSGLTCAGNPSTCTAAATYCPRASATAPHASQRTARPKE
jgi:hypothetical protein